MSSKSNDNFSALAYDVDYSYNIVTDILRDKKELGGVYVQSGFCSRSPREQIIQTKSYVYIVTPGLEIKKGYIVRIKRPKLSGADCIIVVRLIESREILFAFARLLGRTYFPEDYISYMHGSYHNMIRSFEYDYEYRRSDKEPLPALDLNDINIKLRALSPPCKITDADSFTNINNLSIKYKAR